MVVPALRDSVLIVRHGVGRGRIDRYLERVLESLRRESPEFRRRVRVHETGTPPPAIDGVAAVVFWLADPLAEWYPACHAEALAIAAAARAGGIALVNPPESLSNSVKSRQSRLWHAAGIDTPPHRRFASFDELTGIARETGFPLLIRSDEHHTQAGMRVLRDERALATVDRSALELPGSVAPLWDVRESWRRVAPRSIYARLHHKKRLYVLGDRVRTEHVFFSSDPIVSATTCTFASFHWLPRWLHGVAAVLPRDRAAIREDLEFWRRGEQHGELMRRAAAVLGFGFAAIDYSERADGSVILWEANPHAFLPPLGKMRLPRLRHAQERSASYHRNIRDFLLDLCAAERSEP